MTEPTPSPLSPPTLLDLMLGFGKIAVVSFGGGLSAWARQVVVEERRWLDDDDFLSALTLCRILPGPNQLNLAVYVGTRTRGFPGAIAALIGLLTLPIGIILALGAVYFAYRDEPQVQAVLRGITAASVGLTLSMGFKVLPRYKTDPMAWALIVASFIAAGVMRYPLLPTLAVLCPIAIAWYWPRKPRETPTP